MNSLSELSDDFNRKSSQHCDCDFPCFDIATGVLMRRNHLARDEARGTLSAFAELQDISMHALSQAVVDSAAHPRALSIR